MAVMCPICKYHEECWRAEGGEVANLEKMRILGIECEGGIMKSTEKSETPEQKSTRLLRNKKVRERHWRKTGVSDSTIDWMKNTGML